MLIVKWSGPVDARDRTCSAFHCRKLLYLFQRLFSVIVGSVSIRRESWFDGDDPVTFCIKFPHYFGVLKGYALCLLCGVDLKVSSRWLAVVREHVQGKKHMLRDSAFRYANQLPLLTEDGLQ